MKFFFTAMDAVGKEHVGVLSASNENEVAGFLKSEGMFPTSVREAVPKDIEKYGMTTNLEIIDDDSCQDSDDLDDRDDDNDDDEREDKDVSIAEEGEVECTLRLNNQLIETGAINFILSRNGCFLVFQKQDTSGGWVTKNKIEISDIRKAYQTGFLFWKKTHVETGAMYKYSFKDKNHIFTLIQYEMYQHSAGRPGILDPGNR